MAYIRSKKEELAGYQASGEIRPSVDLGCDFIMVYGIDPTMPERIRQYREKGYVIHLMTGIAWGEYQEYLDGKWDGRKHWDEGQVDRNGKDCLLYTSSKLMEKLGVDCMECHSVGTVVHMAVCLLYTS